MEFPSLLLETFISACPAYVFLQLGHGSNINTLVGRYLERSSGMVKGEFTLNHH